MRYLKTFDGRKCPVDLDNPIAMIKGDGFGTNYQRGSLVYPIGDEGEQPGNHHTEGWMTVSTLCGGVANFCGVKVGETAIALKELLEMSGKVLGITYKPPSRLKGSVFYMGDRRIDDEIAIDLMLDHYLTMKLPEEVRSSTELSRSISSETDIVESGIIFEDLKQVAAALVMYSMGATKASTATHDKLYADAWKADNPIVSGVDDPQLIKNTPRSRLLHIGGLINSVRGDILGKLVKEVLGCEGNYRKDFDYDGMGTVFFKTGINVDRIDGKYILGLYAAYVGDEPEKQLAEVLEMDRALVRADSKHELTVIAKEWIGIDVDKALRNGTLNAQQIGILTRFSAGEVTMPYNGYPIEMDGMRINMSFGLEQDENYGPDVIKANGNRLLMKLDGKGKSRFSFSLGPVGKKAVVDAEERARVIGLRDRLSSLVQNNLL